MSSLQHHAKRALFLCVACLPRCAHAVITIRYTPSWWWPVIGESTNRVIINASSTRYHNALYFLLVLSQLFRWKAVSGWIQRRFKLSKMTANSQTAQTTTCAWKLRYFLSNLSSFEIKCVWVRFGKVVAINKVALKRFFKCLFTRFRFSLLLWIL